MPITEELTLSSEELPAIRPDFYNLLDSKLNIEAAASKIQLWSDKLRKVGPREWSTLPAAHQELYKYLTYQIICQLIEGDPWELLDAVDEILSKMKPKVVKV